jgi:hypothetical protein
MADWPTTTDVTKLLSSTKITPSADADITGALAAAKDLFAKLVNREYRAADIEASYRYFEGKGERFLPIDPCTDVTEVALCSSANNEVLTVLATTAWVAMPLNSTTKTYLKRTINNLGWGALTSWSQAHIRVQAKWGEVPGENVVRCVALMAALDILGASIMYCTGGIISWREHESEESYGSTPWKTTRDTWKSQVERIINSTIRWLPNVE